MLSRVVVAISAALLFFASFVFHPRWKKEAGEAAISWDVSGYYWYLPSLFIYHDIKHQSFSDNILNKYQATNTDFQQAFKTDNGNYVLKYSSGMAIMYLPFFTAAHLLAKPLGYPADGFSAPYQFCIQMGGLLVSILGLLYLRKLLLLYFEDKVVAATLLLLVFGTNYLNYAAIDSGMSHCWLFTLYVFLLLNTHYFYKSFATKYAIRIGVIVGLATLTRPSDMLSAIIPLLWGMESISLTAIRNRIQLALEKYKPLLAAAFCAACIVAIQPIYWKAVSGHWLVYSYQDQHLYFRSPNFMNYTFSYRSGWLVYTPAMVLAFLGLVPFIRMGKNRVAIITFFLLNYYVICAWSIWWYGGRAMLQSYPVLLFPVAALFTILLRNRFATATGSMVVACFIYFNFWVTYQAHAGGLLNSDDVNKAYFWKVAGRWTAPEEYQLLKDNPGQSLTHPTSLPAISYDFHDDTATTYHMIDGHRRLLLTHDRQLSTTYRFPLSANAGQQITAAATFYCPVREWENWKMAQFILRAVKDDKVVKESMIRAHRLLYDGKKREVFINLKVPDGGADSVHVIFWNGGSNHPIEVDNLKIWK